MYIPMKMKFESLVLMKSVQSREEIRRLKAKHPNMTHKEAFSAAAKNVSYENKSNI